MVEKVPMTQGGFVKLQEELRSGLGYAGDLIESCLGVCDMLEDLLRDYHVESRISEWDFITVIDDVHGIAGIDVEIDHPRDTGAPSRSVIKPHRICHPKAFMQFAQLLADLPRPVVVRVDPLDKSPTKPPPKAAARVHKRGLDEKERFVALREGLARELFLPTCHRRAPDYPCKFPSAGPMRNLVVTISGWLIRASRTGI